MTAPYRKKLIEVALPLKAINEASAREKSIRHGHPSTLHLWWARRPLAACRAVLFASLVDDPDSDPQFINSDGSVDEDRAANKRAELFSLIEELVQWENSNNPEVIRSARAEIARCVASRKVELGKLAKDHELAPGVTVGSLIRDCWVMPKAQGKFTKGHKQAKGGAKKNDDRVRFTFGTAHLPPESVVNAFLAEHAPPVLDPFAGGGSIPLEAQRLGLRVYASDLNPVAVLINKALIEIPPKFAGRPPVNPKSRKDPKSKAREWRGAEGLAEDVRYYGKWMRDEAEKRIGHLYPKVKVTEEMAKDRPDLEPYVGEDLTVIAWLWAREVTCPNPSCRKPTPLLRTTVLSKKPGRHTHVKFITGDSRTGSPSIFQVVRKQTQDAGGTVSSRSVTCLECGTSFGLTHVREEAVSGKLKSMPLAVVAEGVRERVYLDFPHLHVDAAASACPEWTPDQLVTTPCHDVDRLPMYGMPRWGDAFTARQATALDTLSSLLTEVRARVVTDSGDDCENGAHLRDGGVGALARAEAVMTYLAFAIDRSADFWCSLCTWANQPKNELVAHVFGRQALQMAWDYAEANPFSTSGGNFSGNLEYVAKAIPSVAASTPGHVVQLDAAAFSDRFSSLAIATDPPYYDNVGYSELSDFFYVWLRRSLGDVFPDECRTMLTPKAEEMIAAPYRFEGDRTASCDFFESALAQFFRSVQAASLPDYPFTLFYAFKQAESNPTDSGADASEYASTGWETMLEGLVSSGLSITGTWPMRTERDFGLKSGSNVLASSIVLSCVLRPRSAALTTRREFLNTLKQELPNALRHLQQGNIAPVDLAQAAIGPGMAVFTRYAKVMEADGTSMTVRTALSLINQSLDEVLAEQEGEFDADTRWAIAWFEEYGVDEGPYGTAETLSRAKNTAIEGLKEAGIVKSGSGKVRLLKRDELPDDWDPASDKRLRHWETVQHLIRVLETEGELGAATLLRKLGSAAEPARDLAYRLYSLCERKKWASEALAYNGLVTAWPEIEKLARAARNDEVKQQTLI